MKKMIIAIGFAALCLAQISFLIFQTSRGVSKGVILHIPINLYDPYDPIKGHYLQLGFSNLDLPDNHASWYPDLSDDLYFGMSIYCAVARSSREDYKIVDLARKIPKESDLVFMMAEVDNLYNDGTFSIKYPFDQYFIQADMALDAENYVRDRDLDPILVINIDRQGQSRIEDLLIDGIPVEEYIQEIRKYDNMMNVD